VTKGQPEGALDGGAVWGQQGEAEAVAEAGPDFPTFERNLGWQEQLRSLARAVFTSSVPVSKDACRVSVWAWHASRQYLLWALQHAGNSAEAAGADSSSRGPLIIFTKLRPPQSICTGMYCFRLRVELGVAGATKASGPSCMVRLVVAVHGLAELRSDRTVLDGPRPLCLR
jgi:hypothetical protein